MVPECRIFIDWKRTCEEKSLEVVGRGRIPHLLIIPDTTTRVFLKRFSNDLSSDHEYGSGVYPQDWCGRFCTVQSLIVLSVGRVADLGCKQTEDSVCHRDLEQ